MKVALKLLDSHGKMATQESTLRHVFRAEEPCKMSTNADNPSAKDSCGKRCC